MLSEHNGIELEIINIWNIWKLNHMFLNDHRTQRNLKRKLKKNLEENENKIYQNLMDTEKAALNVKFIVHSLK